MQFCTFSQSRELKFQKNGLIHHGGPPYLLNTTKLQMFTILLLQLKPCSYAFAQFYFSLD